MLARVRSGLVRRLEAFATASSESGNEDEDEDDAEEEEERLRDSDSSEDDDADLEDNVDDDEEEEENGTRDAEESDQRSDTACGDCHDLEEEEDEDSSVGFVPPNTTSNSCDDVREGLGSPAPLEPPPGEVSSSGSPGSKKVPGPPPGRHRRKRHLRRLADLLAARYPALLLDMHEEVMLEHTRHRRDRLLACLAEASGDDGGRSAEQKESQQMPPMKAERLCRWVVREYHRVKRISANQSVFLGKLVS